MFYGAMPATFLSGCLAGSGLRLRVVPVLPPHKNFWQRDLRWTACAIRCSSRFAILMGSGCVASAACDIYFQMAKFASFVPFGLVTRPVRQVHA